MGKNEPLTNRQKKKCFEDWMKADHVLLHLDSNNERVDVPPNLKGNPALTLKLSYQFHGETTHDENSVTSYLRFAGEYHKCLIPWNAIWAITSSGGEQRVWRQSIPKEVLLRFAKDQFNQLAQSLLGKKKADKETAEPLAGDPPPPSNAAPDTTTSPKRTKRTSPTLTRIK